MGLALDDRWIWDFWLVLDGVDHHVFYLQAPTEIGDPDQRHWNVSIGHAVSTDLRQWTVLPDALCPGPAGAWDDASTWTGSVLRHDGRWLMLYTGTSREDGGLVQRIGLAVSDDLLTWGKGEGPVLEADPHWYETLDRTAWHDQAWRDPWLFVDERDGLLHVLLTARSRDGDPAGRGVVGHARASDLKRWEVLPPVTEPMGFGQLEVPQLVELEDRWYLVFCSDVETQAEPRRTTGPGTGTYYLVGDSPTGPFRMLGDGVLEADRAGSTYAGKLHLTADGPVFLAWYRTGPDGGFRGSLADPQPVLVAPDGSLQLAR